MTHEDTASICLAVGASRFGIDPEYTRPQRQLPRGQSGLLSRPCNRVTKEGRVNRG